VAVVLSIRLVATDAALRWRQDFLEKLPRYQDLCHLEHDGPAMPDDPGADLEQPVAQRGNRGGTAAIHHPKLR